MPEFDYGRYKYINNSNKTGGNLIRSAKLFSEYCMRLRVNAVEGFNGSVPV